MASGNGRSRIAVRLFSFRANGNGTFSDHFEYSISGSIDDVLNHVREIFAHLPQDHFAIVCDALPDTAESLGHAGASVELGPVQSEEREGVDSSPQGLARDETSPEEYPGTREREGSRAVAYEREYLRVSTQFHP